MDILNTDTNTDTDDSKPQLIEQVAYIGMTKDEIAVAEQLRQELHDNYKFVMEKLLLIDHNNPTESQVLDHLNTLASYNSYYNIPHTPVSTFYTAAALTSWFTLWSTRNGQPKFVPPRYDQSHVQLIFGEALTPYHCQVLNREIITLADRVDRASQFLIMWLGSKESETKEERRLRQNREAQRRFVQRKKEGAEGSIELTPVAIAYREYLAACKERKAAAQQWAAYIKEKRNAWEQLRDAT